MRGLRLAALLATLVAVLLAALLIGAAREDSGPPGSRPLVSDGATVWVLGPGGSLLASGAVTGRDECPTLVGETDVLVGHGFEGWEYRSLSGDTPLPVGATALHHPGFEVWSPDGTKVAMGETESGEVWIMDLGPLADGITNVEEPRPIPVPGLDWAAWSPDGLRLALVSADAGEEALALRVIDASGTLTSMEPIALPVVDGYGGVTVAWAPDGLKLAVWTRGLEDADEQLVRVVELATRMVTTVGRGTAGIMLSDDGAWSPDSAHLAMVIGSDVVITDVDAGTSERFAVDARVSGSQTVRWWPDGAQLLLEGQAILASVSLDGSRLTVHSDDPDRIAAFHGGELYVARSGAGLVLERFGPDDTTGTGVLIPDASSANAPLCLEATAPGPAG
jgi:hypothetical protein